ncbi:Phosphopantothenoylcysteine decarboxylase [Prochlorococcus marinus str. MIT 9321]|uniref:Coenzyme A biosynthesis bifunctional protein CoaBC n=1 Tax=Prochlorococcus marinus str. MIT 9401 TaxID=167551 RepID=A0A0A2B8A5_PROMR|nr:bifunctional phosphopantothenoylcysteine decarboxylase/phosphopantothenate--cysteine ligase CoaBC [Prochlorococcus marinus]KGG03817.1 Phosphopantothenoylcysteine decarboxylase [Prochlorococcus marinus str. MIT 9321]KGG06315.1 Phosphopantothenoylcysteine decarboxylase [Prochlorococcus marinus str. MIT 9322]KGG10076.1 Phosphopantothenoylcysteine decarboxylase [Prochlorococcus marinus str. MIT 9401]
MKTKSKDSKIKVLILITGSIAAVRIPLLVSQLAKENYEIKCVLSENAEKLIKPLSLSILSRNPCVIESDQWSNSQSKPLHIELSDWADILIIAPLTATTLAKWVTGNAEGLIPSILIANIKPIIVAPAMNTQMWLNKAVQKNYENLQNYENVLSLQPSEGLLACDAVGIGKIPPNDLIQLALEFIISHNKNPFRKDLLNKEILITGGCTTEKIDAARHITNKSSGAMGLLLSQVARFRGAQVKYIHGPLKINKNLTDGIKRYEIETSIDLIKVLNNEITNCDYFFMNAAVSDFKLACDTSAKIPKNKINAYLNKNFELVPDILQTISESKKDNQIFVGFCAFTGSIKEARITIREKIIQKGCDYLFANPIDLKDQGFGFLAQNEGWLFDTKNMEHYIKKTSKIDLANKLITQIIAEKQ